MEFRFSDELSPEYHPTGALAGDIPVRRHRNALREDAGAMRAHADWKQLVGPLDGFKGGMSHKYGLMQVAVPECRPERLEVIAYASELGFLYDDCTESFNQEQIEDANDNMQSAFTEGVRHGQIDSKAGGLKAMQSTLLQEMAAIDKPRAMTAMKVWVEFLQESAGRQHQASHDTFEQYMRYRVLDVGEMFWFGLVTFGMALTVPECDMPRLRELTRPCWIVLSLQNDVCSYQKELEAARQNEGSHIVNAIWVLMKEHDIDVQEATRLCRQHIDENVKRYQQIVQSHRHDATLSKDARIYMESLLYTISDDAVWSLITPRYNGSQTYNNVQVSMLAKGLGVALKRAESGTYTGQLRQQDYSGGIEGAKVIHIIADVMAQGASSPI